MATEERSIKIHRDGLEVQYLVTHVLSHPLPESDVLASDIIENLQSALESFQELQSQIGQ